MKLEEKKQNCRDFIRSESFTEATYGVMIVVGENIQKMINLTELHGILLKRIESGEIKHSFSDDELIKIKQLILIDILSKIMIVMESLFVLYDGLSRFPYKRIPSIMVKYDQQKVDSFIERFQSGKANVWKICGFPRIASLKHNCNLTVEDAKFVYGILEDSCEAVRNTIKDHTDFYQANRILFGKFKHGLLFLPGFTYSRSMHDAPESTFLAFDKLRKRPAKICFQGKEISPPGLEWFNTYSILPYWNHTFKRYSQILREIKDLSTYTINNHLLWASNCGEDYLPMKILPDEKTVVELYLTKQIRDKEQRKFDEIFQRVASNTYCHKRKLEVNFNFSGVKLEKILACFRENESATIWKSSTLMK